MKRCVFIQDRYGQRETVKNTGSHTSPQGLIHVRDFHSQTVCNNFHEETSCRCTSRKGKKHSVIKFRQNVQKVQYITK